MIMMGKQALASLFVAAALLMPTTTTALSVFEIIQNSPDHTLLEDGVVYSGLEQLYTNPGNLTVFAPTDAAIQPLFNNLNITAFDQVPAAFVALAFQYHTLGTKQTAAQLMTGTVDTLAMMQACVQKVSDTNIFVSGTAFGSEPVFPGRITASVEADNGIVHVVDAILYPPALTMNSLTCPPPSLSPTMSPTSSPTPSPTSSPTPNPTSAGHLAMSSFGWLLVVAAGLLLW